MIHRTNLITEKYDKKNYIKTKQKQNGVILRKQVESVDVMVSTIS